jgi:hydrogenase nickel incorporation protein HypB
VSHSLAEINMDDYDVIFIENVGYLVCPADFPLGTDYRVVVVSVTEGDDMVRKHHDIFIHSDLAIVNKIDIADAVDVDPDTIADDYKKLTGGVKEVYKCSVKKDIGLDEILAAMKL